ncbi:MAG: UPF0175 family protein [Cyanobacteria bacterium J06639_1]
MQVTLELPDEVVDWVGAQDGSRRVFELIVADRYRQGAIAAAEVRALLGFRSRWETYEFLKRERAYLDYSEVDLESDRDAIQRAIERG